MKTRSSLLTLIVCFASATGYGQEPVSGPRAQAQTSVDNQGIRNYLLGPGDVLEVRVFGQSEFTSVIEVDSEGNISSLAFLDPIPAKCRTEKQVQKDIATAYAKYMNNAQVSVRIVERKSRPPATIYGAVRQPSQVPMLRSVHLYELLSKSGGLTERASGTIQILHTEPVMCPAPGEIVEPITADGTVLPQVIKIADFKANKPGANPMIRPGDYVSVTEAEPVYITGSVVNPSQIFMRDGLMLSEALAIVSGVRPEAKTNDVIIFRLKEGSNERKIIHVDYAAIKKSRKPDVLLEAYDVVEVREASPLSADRLFATLFKGLAQNVGGVLPSIH